MLRLVLLSERRFRQVDATTTASASLLQATIDPADLLPACVKALAGYSIYVITSCYAALYAELMSKRES